MEGINQGSAAEKANDRQKRLVNAADTYRKGLVSSLWAVSEDPDEQREIMSIVDELNLADLRKEAKAFASKAERMVEGNALDSVLIDFISGLSEEARKKLKTVLQ